MQRNLRRYQNLLSISGWAVIAFCIWNILKQVIYILLIPDELNEIKATSMYETEYEIFAYIFAFVILFLDLGLRLYIGLSARAESNGKKKGMGYVIIAMISATVLGISLIMGIISTSILDDSLVNIIVTLIVDVTSIFAFIELFVSAFNVKSLSKKLAEE